MQLLYLLLVTASPTLHLCSTQQLGHITMHDEPFMEVHQDRVTGVVDCRENLT